jgi:hypothetical protein
LCRFRTNTGEHVDLVSQNALSPSKVVMPSTHIASHASNGKRIPLIGPLMHSHGGLGIRFS